jgi:hypothetical protein
MARKKSQGRPCQPAWTGLARLTQRLVYRCGAEDMALLAGTTVEVSLYPPPELDERDPVRLCWARDERRYHDDERPRPWPILVLLERRWVVNKAGEGRLEERWLVSDVLAVGGLEAVYEIQRDERADAMEGVA